MFDKFLNMTGEECKAMMTDMFFGIGLSEILNETVSERQKCNKKSNGYTNYSGIYSKRYRRENNSDSICQQFRKIRIEFLTREDAEDVLDDIVEKIETSGIATVKDLYEAADMPANLAMYNWFWDNVDGAYIEESVGDKYTLYMPPANPIDPCPHHKHAS